MKVMTLLLLLIGTQLSYATPETDLPIVCTNPQDAHVYTGFMVDRAQHYKMPAGSYSVIDLMLKPVHGPLLLSGKVYNKAGRVLTSSKGNQRWFLLLNDWQCKHAQVMPQLIGYSQPTEPL